MLTDNRATSWRAATRGKFLRLWKHVAQRYRNLQIGFYKTLKTFNEITIDLLCWQLQRWLFNLKIS
jgi:hypothetical protein